MGVRNTYDRSFYSTHYLWYPLPPSTFPRSSFIHLLFLLSPLLWLDFLWYIVSPSTTGTPSCFVINICAINGLEGTPSPALPPSIPLFLSLLPLSSISPSLSYLCCRPLDAIHQTSSYGRDNPTTSPHRSNSQLLISVCTPRCSASPFRSLLRYDALQSPPKEEAHQVGCITLPFLFSFPLPFPLPFPFPFASLSLPFPFITCWFVRTGETWYKWWDRGFVRCSLPHNRCCSSPYLSPSLLPFPPLFPLCSLSAFSTPTALREYPALMSSRKQSSLQGSARMCSLELHTILYFSLHCSSPLQFFHFICLLFFSFVYFFSFLFVSYPIVSFPASKVYWLGCGTWDLGSD